MKNIAIYFNKNKAYITIFTFSEEAFNSVIKAIELGSIKAKGPPRSGNKPGSYKFAIYCTKEDINNALERTLPQSNT